MSKAALLGLTVVAIGVCAGLAPASASAAYKLDGATASTFTGTQHTQNVAAFDIGTLKCTAVALSGSQAAQLASQMFLTPAFSGCKLAAQSVNVANGNCAFQFFEPETAGSPSTTQASVNIDCLAGGEIVIKDTSGLGCEVKIAEQTPTGRAMFTNEAAGTVLIDWELTGIKYSWTAGCPNSKGKAGSNTNGTYVGSTDLSAKNDGGVSTGFSVEAA